MYVVNKRIGKRALVYLFSYRLQRCIRQRTRFIDVCYRRLLRTSATDTCTAPCYGRLLRTSVTDACTAAAVAPSERRFWCSSRDQDFSL
jgi:hypothetical protein